MSNYIIKVTVSEIESKGKKFNVYNTYVRNDDGSFTKLNVVFDKAITPPKKTSNVFVPKGAVSVKEYGKYPTMYITNVEKVQEIKFDKKNLDKYFKSETEKDDVRETVNEMMSDKEEKTVFDEVEEKDLPF